MGFPRAAFRVVFFSLVFLLPFLVKAQTTARWSGVVRDAAGKTVVGATIELHASGAAGAEYHATSAANGEFTIATIRPGSYEVAVTAMSKTWKATEVLDMRAGT